MGGIVLNQSIWRHVPALEVEPLPVDGDHGRHSEGGCRPDVSVGNNARTLLGLLALPLDVGALDLPPGFKSGQFETLLSSYCRTLGTLGRGFRRPRRRPRVPSREESHDEGTD